MSISTSIIAGEAAETDSDGDDEGSNNTRLNSTKSKMPSGLLQGEIVNGEDSESDEDANASNTPSSKARSKRLPSGTMQLTARHSRRCESLLHKKLSESNAAIHRSMHSFFCARVNEAATALNNTDRQLMKSQLTLQTALSSLRALSANAVQIKGKLRNVVVDDNYLHNLAIISD